MFVCEHYASITNGVRELENDNVADREMNGFCNLSIVKLMSFICGDPFI
jgi:hypothetical protein